ncbi:hypothetical protein ACFVKC_01915 [Streptomyces noursei]|uniref:hypothetical protein n=1 Tax=Streptomyces noursei TaxID=1971 RepID=UPI00362C0855
MTHGRGVAFKAEGESIGSAEQNCVPRVALHIDHEGFDFHITAGPGYRVAELRHVLALAEERGLKLLDEDERDPELLEDGSVRLYLMPAVKI